LLWKASPPPIILALTKAEQKADAQGAGSLRPAGPDRGGVVRDRPPARRRLQAWSDPIAAAPSRVGGWRMRC